MKHANPRNTKNGKIFFFQVYQSNIDIFLQEVGEDILPAELGGNNGTIDDIKEFWMEELPKHSAFLTKVTKYKTDESRRADGPKTSNDLFGSCSIM